MERGSTDLINKMRPFLMSYADVEIYIREQQVNEIQLRLQSTASLDNRNTVAVS